MNCLCGLTLLACGDDGTPAGPVGGPPSGEVSEDDATADDGYVQPGPWSAMDKSQRFEFMNQVVMPEMGALFREFDAEKYATFSCGTCHGEDAASVGFEMPNGIAPLSVAEFPLTKSSNAEIAAAAVFMEEKVVPRMVELLELEPWSPDNREGFGCFGCHGREGDEG